MINLRNALVLAGTKLKTRKIRLTITVIISSLMFGILAFGIITLTGFTNSITRFSQEGLNNRFFVQIVSFSDGFEYVDYVEHFQKPATIAKANQIANEMVEQRAKRARELGLEFDKKLELAKILPESQRQPSEKMDNLIDRYSPIGQKLFEEMMKDKPQDPLLVLNRTNVDRITSDFTVLNTYQVGNYSPAKGTFAWANNQGAYPLPASEIPAQKPGSDKEKPTFSFINTAPETIVKPFRLSQAKWSASSKTLPIFVSYTQAQQLLDLQPLPKQSSAKEFIERQSVIQTKIANFKFKHCFRNDLATEQLQQAKVHLVNKNAKDYIAPELIYSLPTNDACALATTLSDKRSAETKKHEAAQHQFDAEFNQRSSKPIAQEITFEVVGIIPSNEDNWDGSFAGGLINFAIGSPGLQNTVSSEDFQVAIKNQGLENILTETKTDDLFRGNTNPWIVELSTIDETARFMKQKGCDFSNTQSIENGRPTCSNDRPFMIMPAVNNRIILMSTVDGFLKFIFIALGITMFIATIIMTGTVGRMITDSRRETAVFRAIGFKRFDISRVYGLYAFIVCLLIIGVSLIIGFAGSSFVASIFNDEMTNRAILATGTTNHALKINLIGVSPLYLGALTAAILIVGLLAIIIPLIRNLRRNPIKDMRDE